MPAKEWRTALGLVLALKTAALLCLYAGWKFLPAADYGVDLWMTRPAATFLDNLANFDGAWFVRVAALGYRRLAEGDYDLDAETRRLRVLDRLGYEQGRWPPEKGERFDRGYGFRHWPLFPLLVRAVSAGGVDPVAAGVILSNLFSLIYGLLLYYLVRLDHPRRTSILAVALANFHPGGYALSAVFNESLFLALAAAAMIAARHGRWMLCGVLGLLLAAARLDGLLLLAPLGTEWLARRSSPTEKGAGLAAAFGAKNLRRGLHGFLEFPGIYWAVLFPLGTLFVIYYFFSLTGDALIWSKVHEVNRYGHVNWPWLMMAETYRKGWQVWMKELPLHGFLLLVLILSFRKLRGTYWIWMAVFFLYHVSNANHSYLRYQVQCIPLFIALAELAEEREGAAAALLAGSAGLCAVFGAMFMNGYWVA